MVELTKKTDQQLWDDVRGCTDGGCQIVTASGMCTNGGCTCIPRFSTKFKQFYTFEDRKRLIVAFHGYKAKVRLMDTANADLRRDAKLIVEFVEENKKRIVFELGMNEQLEKVYQAAARIMEGDNG